MNAQQYAEVLNHLEKAHMALLNDTTNYNGASSIGALSTIATGKWKLVKFLDEIGMEPNYNADTEQWEVSK